MKKRMIIFSVMLALGLTACGQTNRPSGRSDSSKSGTTAETTEKSETSGSTVITGDSKVLIAYFTVPEDVDTADNDAVAGSSIVVKNSEKMGNTEYVAKLVQETAGGDLFQIETKDVYPLEHEALVDQAADEQEKNIRPELSGQVENFEQYDTVILGFAGGIIGLN